LETNLYFIFYHSMKCDPSCEGCDNDGASYEMMFLGCAWLVVFFFLACDYSDVCDGTRFTIRKTSICD